jgi:DNA adenine methylase
MRPALRYYGGKWKLAPWVIAHFPPHRIYLEAYSGGASVLLQKPRVYGEILNDLDDQVTNVFRVLRDPALAAALKEAVGLTPFARSEFEAAYSWSDDPVEQARRAIVRSFMGFGSNGFHGKRGMRTMASPWRSSTGFRSDAKRSGSTPAKDWSTWPESIPAFTERLRGVVIENRDGLELLVQHDSADTLHYLDPPYLMSTRSSKGKYTHELDEDGHRRLAEVATGLEGHVVISGYPSALYEDLYRGWIRVERAAMADGSRARTEVLWLSPSSARALEASRPSLFDLLETTP